MECLLGLVKNLGFSVTGSTPVAQLVLRVGCRRVGTYGDVGSER